MNDEPNGHDRNHNSESIPANPNQHHQKGTEHEPMTDTTALTPIRGSNGYQQLIAIDPKKPLDLSITNARGEIKVQASDQPNVWVVVRRTDGRTEEETVQVTVSVEGNRISIRPSWQVASGISGFARKLKDQLQTGLNTNEWKFDNLKFSPDLDYDMRIEVPRNLFEGSRISAKSASGSIEANGLHAVTTIASASGSVVAGDLDGRVAIHSASGSVRVKSVTGSLEVNTASGSIKVEDGETWVALRTVSGSITVDRFTMKNARITTVSGSVHGSAIINNQSDYSFETVSGSLNLNVVLPADGVSTLNFKSLSGSANAGGDWQSDGKRSWHAGSGGAGPTMRVKTVSGSLNTRAHLEPSIPTRHEALPEPIFPDHDDHDADQATAPFPAMPSFPSVPPVPPVPPTGAATPGYRAEHLDRSERGNNDETQPIFTPPADWPDWIKSTARTVEETARHVVTSFQQPVEPLPSMDAQRSQPGKNASTSPAQSSAPGSTVPVTPTPTTTAAPWAQRPTEPPITNTTPTTANHPEIDRDQLAADQKQAEIDRKQAVADRQHAEDVARRNGGPAQAAVTANPEHSGADTAPAGDTRSLDDQDEAERLRILEALERGEIDIDEALSKIEQEETRGA